MKHFSQQLHKKAKATVKLQAAEKSELRERLMAYMEYHPLPADLKPVKKDKPVAIPADPFTVISIPFAKLFKISSVVAAFVLIVVPFVAERAVPGDVLYAVKVQFNEEVRGSLTFDTYEKVEWETERLNRRIAEARLLASQGLLTEEVEAEVADAVRTHTASAQREIEELRTEDADAATIASIALDSTLEVQSSSLKGEDDSLVASLNTKSEDRAPNLIADAIDESRTKAEVVTASTTLPSYDKLMARVEQNTTRIYELLNALKKVAPAEDLVEVTRRVEDTDRAILTATGLVEKDLTAARNSLIEALQRSQRLIVYMSELMVIQTVDIETLIPVVLTESEEGVEVEEVTTEVKEKTEKIKSILLQVEDKNVREKVNHSLVMIEENYLIMTSTTTDYKAFGLVASETLLLIEDSLSLLEKQTLPDIPEVTESASTTATTTEVAVEIEESATSTEEVGTTTESGEVVEIKEEVKIEAEVSVDAAPTIRI